MTLSGLLFAFVIYAQCAAGQENVSPIAGSTQTHLFPPAGVTATIPDPNFPDGAHIGFAGPTPSKSFAY